jgi:hypothetical protein
MNGAEKRSQKLKEQAAVTHKKEPVELVEDGWNVSG